MEKSIWHWFEQLQKDLEGIDEATSSLSDQDRNKVLDEIANAGVTLSCLRRVVGVEGKSKEEKTSEPVIVEDAKLLDDQRYFILEKYLADFLHIGGRMDIAAAEALASQYLQEGMDFHDWRSFESAITLHAVEAMTGTSLSSVE